MSDQIVELRRLSAVVRLRAKRSEQLYQLLCRLSARIGAGSSAACAADADGYRLRFMGTSDGGAFLEVVCRADEPDCPPVSELGVLCERARVAWRLAAVRYTAAREAFRTVGEQFLADIERGIQ